MNRDAAILPEASSPGLEALRILGLFLAFAAQLYVGGRFANAPPGYCFTRPFWLDEIHTVVLAEEEQSGRMLYKLAHGGDCSPPALHVALWLILKTRIASEEVLVRCFSCAVGLAGVAATYLLLRVGFVWPVAWVAVLGMWSSSPQLIQQMFEGRPYSLWFAGVALLCLLLGVRTKGFWVVPCVAVTGALICLTHYFGIITVGLISVVQLGCNFRDMRQRRLIAAALVGGAAGLVASLPICLAQRASVPAQSWVPSPTINNCADFLGEYLLVYAFSLPVLGYALQRLLHGNSESDLPANEASFQSYAGACGLILLPAVLIVFSYVVQPAQITRYAVPATVAYAPLIALVATRLNRAILKGLALLFFLIGLKGAIVVHEGRPDFREAAPLVSMARADRPLVVHWRAVAYPMCRYTGADPATVRVSFLYRSRPLSRFDAWEYALTRRMSELFNLPKTLERTELSSLDEFYLLVVSGEEKVYSGWTAEPLNVVVGPLRGFRMTRFRNDNSPAKAVPSEKAQD